MYPFRPYLADHPFYAILALESVLNHRRRHLLKRLSGWLITLLLLIVLWVLGETIFAYDSGIADWVPVVVGLLGLDLVLWLSLFALEAFFRHHYLNENQTGITFEVAQIFYQARDADLVLGFLDSTYGRRVLARAGVPAAEQKTFYATRAAKRSGMGLEWGEKGVLTLQDLAGVLYDKNSDLHDWLLKLEINRTDWLGAASWVAAEERQARFREAWWQRRRLERSPGLAKTWAYGATFLLEKYGEDLLLVARGNTALGIFSEAVEKIETILSRAQEANALVVGEGQAPRATLEELAVLISRGRVVPALEHKRPFLLRSTLLLAAMQTGPALEKELLVLLEQARRAGNIIFIIDDLPALMRGAASLGVALGAVLDPYLAGRAIQVVALADPRGYQDVLEPDIHFRERFERVLIKALDAATLLPRAVEFVRDLERQYNLYFTYPGLVELADAAERLFAGESLADQLTDLLLEIAPWSRQRGIKMVDHVATRRFVSEKSGVPRGLPQGAEREKLLQLESALSARVIGQDQAIVAVASALRRNRAGLRNPNRPIGSFLFLGPTGVGKTETAKALAALFFDGEDRMIRLDMSEYQGADALGRLIGTADQAGALTSALTTRPYGVLLLDEFEKSTLSVRDLFLQIVDEGFFTNGRGERVSTRNVIIIATSNAGAELIWEIVKSGKHLAEERSRIVQAVIKQGAFKPELINRFDAVVIFNPLQGKELEKVASLGLAKLAQRLEGQGIILAWGANAAARVAERGADRVFGARPMARFIQDALESPIAIQILSGKLKSGDRISAEDVLAN